MNRATCPGELPAEQEALWREAMRNPDFKTVHQSLQHPHPEGQRTFVMYHHDVPSPGSANGVVERAEETFKSDQDSLLYGLRRGTRTRTRAALAGPAQNYS